jgi:putative endonuclease
VTEGLVNVRGMSPPVPVSTRKVGQQAEELAAEFLVSQGYVVVERNFTCRFGELDLVALRDGLVCVVEVRMRSSNMWGDPALTVSWAKQRRVLKATLHYLMRQGWTGRMVRFDVIAIVGRGPGAQLEHIPNAFDAGM